MLGEKYALKLSTMERKVIIAVSISVIGLAIMGKYGYLALHIFPILSETQCPAFYTAIVTSLAAILAIVFAISLIAIQHAADKYTPSILERYKNDKKTIMMYVLFSIGIVFGILALWFGWNYKGAFLAFILLVICLMVLFVQFRSVVDFVNPLKLIETLKKETLNELIEKLKREMLNEKWKKIWKRNPKMMENDRIRRNCFDLKEIAIKSIERNEDKICIESVKALKKIVEGYVKVLKEIMETLPEESQKEELIADLQRLNSENILPMLREIGVTAARQRRGFVGSSEVMSAIESVSQSIGMLEFVTPDTIGMKITLVDKSIDMLYIIGEEVTANKPDKNDLAAVVSSLHSLCREFESDKHLKVEMKKIILYIYRFSIKAAEHQYYWMIRDTLQFYDELIRKRTEDAEIISLIIRDSICICAAGIKNLSQGQDRRYLRTGCFSILNHFLENKDTREYFDKAKEYCPDYEKEIEELKERFEKYLKKFKGEKD